MRETTVSSPPSGDERDLERDVERPVLVRAQVGQRLGVLRAARATRCGSSASSGTIHGEIEVANDLPRNGPSGTYSQRWMSRALQSLTSTKPKMCSRASRRRRSRVPSALPGPGDEAQLELDVEPLGRPEARRAAGLGGRELAAAGGARGVPETTTELARPW